MQQPEGGCQQSSQGLTRPGHQPLIAEATGALHTRALHTGVPAHQGGLHTGEEEGGIPVGKEERIPVGFCPAAGSLWIYPTNYPVRGYQLRMARSALLGNTLVCLPTGLGKTFVAAVVMYNFYRWFPSGKVLFLAPTKPLVAQQMEACAKVMGIPARHMAEMTGGTQALSRRELWATKRVFFLTPQIMVNDLSRGTCPAVEVKCLVVDEAHKALGNHAYCQVVRELGIYTKQFRILALSATPGSDTKAVQQVISNLLIAQIELCTEDSPEIQPYSHERQVEKIVVPLGEELVDIQNAYIQVLETFAGRLIKIGVLARRDIPSLTKYQIILARDQYRKNPSSQNMGIHQGIIEGDFALCISLYHGYELLLQMGMRSLFIYLSGIMDGSKGLTRTKNELGRNEDFVKLYQQLRDMFSDTPLASESGNVYNSKPVFENKKEFIYSHPKLRKLEEIVIEHFRSWKKKSSDTRVMIFSSFRDSVQEIAEMLSRLRPVVRVMTFVGHSTGKSTKGFTQKEQLEVVRRFRAGGYNTLVSTCVGEEGLDIGEVDLIICFDAQKSPVRLVQRMGRTGRRRQGRIVVILAEGREERTYNQSQSNKRSIHKAISGSKTLHFYQHSPRMIPEGITPKLHKMFITAEKYEPSNSRALSKERRPSSLQHKSALFSCVAGQKQTHCHESWCLSPEEFEIWDRLYRIKESDGAKAPILPRSRFETLEDLEEIPVKEAVCELSLSEWSIWQSRPFPTSLIGHSDRCYHFISVMEMIELMRHEQGDCSYDLEIQPHLRIEDVNVQRNKRHLPMTSSAFGQKAHSSRKDVTHRPKVKPFPLDTDDNGSEFFSTFKIAKPKSSKRTSGLNLEMPVLPTDINTSASCSARRVAVVENTDQGSQKEEEPEVTFDLNECIDLCDNSESAVVHEGAVIKESKTVDKAGRSLGTNQTDSGYGSFTAEESPVSSDLFYLPESYVDSFELLRPSEDPSSLKQISSHVKSLLSQPPPSSNELHDLENMMRDEETRCPFQEPVSDSHLERLPGKGFSVSSEVDHSLLLFANPGLKATSELCVSVNTSFSKSASSPKSLVVKAKEETHRNDSSFSLFANEEFTEIEKKAPTINHSLTNKPSNKYFVQKDKEDLKMNKKNVIIVGSPPEVGCVDTKKTCEEQPVGSESTNMETSGSISVTKQFLDDDDDDDDDDELYDCSQELFSVNFDLGFSIDEFQSDICEEPINTTGTSSGSDEEVVFRRKNRKKMNVLKSPDTDSDDSMDFQKSCSRSTKSNSAAQKRNQLRSTKRQKVKSSFPYKNAGREFLDEEAELSQQDADGVSSDESDEAENELNSSLAQFLDDDVEITQVLNEGEMEGVYLQSVRSPVLGNQYKMVHREFSSRAIFSQIPEQDQSYAEDSFCVGEEEEETFQKSESSEEEVCVNFDLLNNESFTSGRKQYLTRRRKELTRGRMEGTSSVPGQKNKPSRVIVISDSSEEETSVSSEKLMRTDCCRAEQENTVLPKAVLSVSSVQHKKSAGETSVHQPVRTEREMLLSLKASVSEMLDFHPEHQARSTRSQHTVLGPDSGKEAPLAPAEQEPSLCVLADSREISSGAEVISSLKATHGVKVQVCSLSSSDYIVSSRVAVERRFLSELLNSMNRSKVTQRIQRLQSTFERVCVIVEKDRVKAGETSRFSQRTQHYDGLLCAWVQAGVRILFSSGQEETAGLLKALALVEHRKKAAIRVPTEVEGHKRDMLNFYLSIPNLSYLAALNMCHHFDSVKRMVNSSPLDIARAAQVSPQKAEEIYQYLHHSCDLQLLPEGLCARGRHQAAAQS
ncbi:PREDICTED: Fanconi anemia group M protein [Chaetura pelagica]|uniref:Fanconi anemia group M protein n=1 Tax=Chaetura pelagica TaxID=8897 RepID=UPI00052354C6|nr:PREDICTED: Fanconi anemia group M protein [Chaetura pelagica]